MRRARLRGGVVAACAAVGFAGCGADSYVAPEPTLSSIQDRVFSRSCVFSSCHGGTSPKAGLDLRAGSSWSNLVNAPALSTTNAWLRVVPGHPELSYLMNKLTGTGVESNPQFPSATGMPPMQPLRPEAVEAIREWIRRGALDDAAPAAGRGGGAPDAPARRDGARDLAPEGDLDVPDGLGAVPDGERRTEGAAGMRTRAQNTKARRSSSFCASSSGHESGDFL